MGEMSWREDQGLIEAIKEATVSKGWGAQHRERS